MSAKVWKIGSHKKASLESGAEPRFVEPRIVEPPPLRIDAPRSDSRARTREPRCHSAASAYLLGPIAAGLWGAPYADGMAGDLAALVVGLGVLLAWSPLTQWLGRVPYGLAIWLVIVPTAALAVATAWARSIAAARVPSATPGTWVARWGNDPRVVAVLGLAVPGLGLMLAKCRRQAAASFWLLGPLWAAGAVLLNRRWLWEHSRSVVSPGLRGTALESVFVAAAAVGALALVAWIVQALDGARRVSSTQGRSDAVGLALLVVATLFVATFHPASLGRDLYGAASGLRADGFRMIPFALCETAARLDPATPVYWAEAADLAESLGLGEKARAHRAMIERRAVEWRFAAGIDRPGAASSDPAVAALPRDAGVLRIW
ncbi:MAG: hypothetical protein U0167_13600 [bacterium]